PRDGAARNRASPPAPPPPAPPTPTGPPPSPRGPPANTTPSPAPAVTPLPNVNPHRPSILSGRPARFASWPRKRPLFGLNTLIRPSPKLPTSSLLLTLPRPAGANVSPHGESNVPCDARRRSRCPL